MILSKTTIKGVRFDSGHCGVSVSGSVLKKILNFYWTKQLYFTQR